MGECKQGAKPYCQSLCGILNARAVILYPSSGGVFVGLDHIPGLLNHAFQDEGHVYPMDTVYLGVFQKT